MNDKKILISINITISVILLLSIAIFSINKKENVKIDDEMVNSNIIISNNNAIINNKDIYYNEIENNQIISNKEYNKVQYVTEKEEYFTIKNIIEKYIELMKNDEKETIINLLSPNYIEEFNITVDNIKYSIPKTENDTQYYYLDIQNMLVANISNRTKLYFINANVSIKYSEYEKPLKVMIETDEVELTYNIYLEEYLSKYKLNNLQVGDTIKFNESEILIRNNFNKYTYVRSLTDKEIANELFNDYIYKLQTSVNNAYERLNSDYAKSRFESKEAFIKYIENNKSNIALMKINKYKVYNSDNYTDYICTDQYNNYYIFRQQDGIMRYTVFLDTYTVELDTFKEEYNNSKNDESKLSIQLGKITQMLNNKDYNAIYNKLNETFRNNNYTNVSRLEEYLKNNIYNINSVVITDYEKNYDYYVCKATIQNQKNTNESKEMNLIIKLIDSDNFEISFSFN